MPSASTLLSCAEAMHLVRANFAQLPQPAMEAVALGDALHRVLAQAVLADRDQPPFPRSTRDGFAVRSFDLAAAQPLRIIGSIRAGEQWIGPALAAGEALEIMTGAPVPGGADAVLMVEHAARHGDGLAPERTLIPGSNIVPQGAEAHAGQILLRAGVRIGPAEIALAASVGAVTLAVFRRPLVAILSTGDELVQVEQTPALQQIRNSNAHALAALIRQNGGEPLLLPVARDTRESLQDALDQAASAAMLILSGGVSAGKYDHVEPLLLSRGAELLFTGVLMQPGKPAVFGRISGAQQSESQSGSDTKPEPQDRTAAEPRPQDGAATETVISTGAGQLHRLAERRDPLLAPAGSIHASCGEQTIPPTQWIFGLPGNPVSTQVTAMLFAMPMLRALGGEQDPQPAFASATLDEPVTVQPGLTRFLPARLMATMDGTTVRPTGWQGSGDLHSNARANCYLVIPSEVDRLDKGHPAQVLLR